MPRGSRRSAGAARFTSTEAPRDDAGVLLIFDAAATGAVTFLLSKEKRTPEALANVVAFLGMIFSSIARPRDVRGAACLTAEDGTESAATTGADLEVRLKNRLMM